MPDPSGTVDWRILVEERFPRLLDPDVREELAQHLEQAYAEALAGGLSESEARASALTTLPDWEALVLTLSEPAEAARHGAVWRRNRPLSDLARDLRYGFRVLRQSPGYAALAVAALALGIGANTIVFSFVRGFLFNPLPVAEPARLVRLYRSLPQGFEFASIAYPDYESIRNQASVFDSVLAEKFIPVNVGAGESSDRVWGYLVSPGYFDTLGIDPQIGRFFSPLDRPNAGEHPVVVVSHGFWRRHYGGDGGILGETLLLNGHPFTIVGVAPENFGGTNVGIQGELWASTAMVEVLMPGFDLDERRHRSFLVLGRLAAGETLDSARANMNVLAERLAADYPDANRGSGIRVLAESEGGIHPVMRGGFLGFSSALALIVLLVLVLACTNVAGLMLCRAAYRKKEVSVRLALGATRGRLVRQLLTESVLLSFLACAVGVALAGVGIELLKSVPLPTDLPLYFPLAMDGGVVAFAVTTSIATALLFGLAPSLQATTTDLVPALKNGGSAAGYKRSTLRSVLVAGQVALTSVLLICAGLFLRSLHMAQSIELGFQPQGLVMASVDLELQGFEVEPGLRFIEELDRRVSELAGVASVGWAGMLPFDLNIEQHELAPEGFQPPVGGGFPSVDVNVVSRNYFPTMGTPILAGRNFDERDTLDAPPAVIVNRAYVERFWAGADAVGKRVVSAKGSLYEVVGVVPTGKYLTLGEDPKPVLFYSVEQRGSLTLTMVARMAPGADAHQVLTGVRERVRALDAGLPVYGVKTMEEHMRMALAPATAGATILGAFGVVALALASLGLYGVLGFMVAQRTFEIGLRRALGADRRDILRAIMGQGLKLAALGLAAGLVVSALVTRALTSVLYGTSPVDPFVYLGAVIMLVLAACTACYIPARRASRVDPIVALRCS